MSIRERQLNALFLAFWAAMVPLPFAIILPSVGRGNRDLRFTYTFKLAFWMTSAGYHDPGRVPNLVGRPSVAAPSSLHCT